MRANVHSSPANWPSTAGLVLGDRPGRPKPPGASSRQRRSTRRRLRSAQARAPSSRVVLPAACPTRFFPSPLTNSPGATSVTVAARTRGDRPPPAARPGRDRSAAPFRAPPRPGRLASSSLPAASRASARSVRAATGSAGPARSASSNARAAPSTLPMRAPVAREPRARRHRRDRPRRPARPRAEAPTCRRPPARPAATRAQARGPCDVPRWPRRAPPALAVASPAASSTSASMARGPFGPVAAGTRAAARSKAARGLAKSFCCSSR